MNPFVVWMPTIAAAAIFTTAAYVSMDDDPVEPDYAPAPEREPEREPEPERETEADAESNADVDAAAARDDDGSDTLELMENQLRTARRIASSNKNSAPTKKGRRDLKALANKAGYGLKRLSQMRNTVPDQTFSRAEEIVKEIKALQEEINDAYRKYREEREPAAPAAAVPAAPVAVAADPYPSAEPVYDEPEYEDGESTDGEEENPARV
jgi:hypothetical protein